MRTSNTNYLHKNFGMILLCKHAIRNIKSNLHVKSNWLVNKTRRQIYKNMDLWT